MVVKTNGDIVDHSDSYCHPQIIPRYSNTVKVLGSVAHIATVGIPYVISKISQVKTWPGASSNEKWCIRCKTKPGSNPCTQIETRYSSENGETIMVTHMVEVPT